MTSPSEVSVNESGIAVTQWLGDLRRGNASAATRLWNYLEPRLLSFGKRQMQSVGTACYDEEDLAQSAFYAFCKAIQQGRYEGLANRNEIWKLLVTIALNKFRKRLRRDGAISRGGELQRHGMEILLESESNVLTADLRLQIEEECERLLQVLGNDEVRKVAILKVEGYTHEEIADALQCTRRTVQRRLDFIRTVWSRDL